MDMRYWRGNGLKRRKDANEIQSAAVVKSFDDIKSANPVSAIT